mmetsp:Transcript_52289/g.111343  ORF Transcript_52289/g.111343 Transcript_52289/m.111343 type:complete len:381 (+) Transcript_52289:165-1307(+)
MSLASLLNLGKKEPEKKEEPPKPASPVPTPASPETAASAAKFNQEDLKLVQELTEAQAEASKEEAERRREEEERLGKVAINEAAQIAAAMAKKRKEAAANPFSTGGQEFKPGVWICDTVFGNQKPPGARSLLPEGQTPPINSPGQDPSSWQGGGGEGCGGAAASSGSWEDPSWYGGASGSGGQGCSGSASSWTGKGGGDWSGGCGGGCGGGGCGGGCGGCGGGCAGGCGGCGKGCGGCGGCGGCCGGGGGCMGGGGMGGGCMGMNNMGCGMGGGMGNKRMGGGMMNGGCGGGMPAAKRQRMGDDADGSGEQVPGVIKSFNPTKGFGFLSCPIFDGDVYFKGSFLPPQMQTASNLSGTQVMFTLNKTGDGRAQAANLVVDA